MCFIHVFYLFLNINFVFNVFLSFFNIFFFSLFLFISSLCFAFASLLWRFLWERIEERKIHLVFVCFSSFSVWFSLQLRLYQNPLAVHPLSRRVHVDEELRSICAIHWCQRLHPDGDDSVTSETANELKFESAPPQTWALLDAFSFSDRSLLLRAKLGRHRGVLGLIGWTEIEIGCVWGFCEKEREDWRW